MTAVRLPLLTITTDKHFVTQVRLGAKLAAVRHA